MNEPADIRTRSVDDLRRLVQEFGQPSYRGQQIAEWLWTRRVRSFDEMSNLPKQLRTLLRENFSLKPAEADQVQESGDGSVKVAYRLHDGELVEGVLIPSGSDVGGGDPDDESVDRITACISSQVGCSLRCAFCATARIPMKRNLSAGEIIDQVHDLNERARSRYGRPLTNIVYMGMGEPLSNYDAVVRSVRLLTSKPGFAMAARRITLSTAGLVPGMRRLAEENINLNLALSLHAATDPVRQNLMSSARDFSLDELAAAVRYWYERHGRKVTFEYLLLAGRNDSEADAKALVRFAVSLPCKVNIIEYNPVLGIPFSAADRDATNRFARHLAGAGITVTVRHSSGKDIDAACGQLAGRSHSNDVERTRV